MQNGNPINLKTFDLTSLQDDHKASLGRFCNLIARAALRQAKQEASGEDEQEVNVPGLRRAENG